MTDEQTLFATIVVLYVAECAAWVQRGAAAFVSRPPSRDAAPDGDKTPGDAPPSPEKRPMAWRARLAFPRRGLSNNRGGFVLGNLWPGSAGTFVVPQWPASLGRAGVAGWVAESLEKDERATQTGLFRRWEDIGTIGTRGSDVVVDGDVLCTAPSGGMARRVAAAIERFRGLDPDARADALDELASELMDTHAIQRRLDAFHEETSSLRTASGILSLALLAGTPIVVIWAGFERTWPLMLAVIYLLTWVVAALFVGAHRRLGTGSRWERWGHCALLALLPLNAMRAPDVLARAALSGFHPLAVARLLAPREQVLAFAAHLLRDLRAPRRPVCLPQDPGAAETEAEYRAALLRAMERMLERAGLDLSASSKPPAPEEGCEGYCPRCLSQYGAGIDVCADCSGVPLSPLRAD